MNLRKRIALAAATTALGTGLAVVPAAGATASAAPAATPAAVTAATDARLAGPYGCNYTNSEPTLSLGSRGKAVKEAQCLLKHWNVDIGRHGVDGKFGTDTRKAVREFQRRIHSTCHMPVDGIVGKKTWHALKHTGC
ncbi:peptidoglycan-binding domain-containing protein [Streptomyces rimosus]|uniref:peptidoglycan-binding domain-containing protein n=1 Tax=Streptomyces TaxID=1883 RepID=UPI000519B084|nr:MULTISPECIES: peptidoglycan-binding domain-containing protein [Streptomyces]RSO21854.1 serine/threonine protein kinase [Streptomyces sp. WAC 06725]